MLRTALLASAIAVGAAAGAAQAQSYPSLQGGGVNAEVEYGGAATMTGSGYDRSTTYGTVNAFPGQLGHMVGGGQDAQVVYDTNAAAPAAPANGVAARTARGGVRG